MACQLRETLGAVGIRHASSHLVIVNIEARAAFKKAVVLIGLTEEQVKKLKAIELDFDRAQIESDAEP